MKTLALTGGIATGKSTASRYLAELMPGLGFYDCDLGVKGLLGEKEVLEEISEKLGQSIILENGELDRGRLRELVFEDSVRRQKLEGVLHPLVRKECLEKREECLTNSATTLFVADVPLLFEGGFDFGQELNLVVATSPATQRARLKSRSHFDDSMISSILRAQLPIMEKVNLADVVFWNEGPPAILRRQLSRFLDTLSTE